MEKAMVPERCVDHKLVETEILSRLKTLEEDVKEIYAQLRDKMDSEIIKELMARSTKEIEELKKAILRLETADQKHSEALAGIHEILKSFKETQDSLRQDYNKLTDCYTQTSVHIASMTAILAERAKVMEKQSTATSNPKSETSNDPWYIRLMNKSKLIAYSVVALITTIIWMIVTRFNELIALIDNIFGK